MTRLSAPSLPLLLALAALAAVALDGADGAALPGDDDYDSRRHGEVSVDAVRDRHGNQRIEAQTNMDLWKSNKGDTSVYVQGQVGHTFDGPRKGNTDYQGMIGLKKTF